MLTLGACAGRGNPDTGAPGPWRVPPEHDRHAGCWMAWPAREDVWGDELAGVRADIARLATAIARYEPVSMLCPAELIAMARAALPTGVRLLPGSVDDCWTRDSGPVFVRRGADLAAVDLNFNGWGGRQVSEADATVAGQIARHARVPLRPAGFTGEGGGLEFDGDGTVMVTAPSLANDNRNPGRSREELADELRAAFGVRQVVWLPGGWTDVTDGHIDAFARFTAPGRVLVEITANRRDPDYEISQANLAALRQARDARGRRLEITTFERAPLSLSESPDFCPCAINYYVANGAVVMARFDDERTHQGARAAIGRAYPDREVVAVPIPTLADGGGGVHCVTQQQPTPSPA